MDIIAERMRNQLLVDESGDSVEQVIAHLGAVQAQDFQGAKWALALRLKDATSESLDALFNDGRILRTHVLRPTWHFVLPEDIRWMLELTAPRVSQAMTYYNRKLELDRTFFDRSNAIIGEALAGGNALTRTEIAGVLTKHGINASGQRLGHIVMQAELDGVVCSGPLRGRQFTYALLGERAPNAMNLDREESLALLAGRYFTSHGPATVYDFAWWSGLTIRDAKLGLRLCEDRIVSEAVNGKEYWFCETAERTESSVPKFLLLSVYDEYVISYSDYSLTFPSETQNLTKLFGNAWLNYVVVKDGRVIGSCRRNAKPKMMSLEFRLAVQLTRNETLMLEKAAERYAGFFGLPLTISYSSNILPNRLDT